MKATFATAAVLSTLLSLARTDAETSRPRLLVFVCIDQARFDYLERFRPVLTGGLKHVMDQGVAFTDAHHNHAVTATGPGHASLSTGLYPSRSGIIANDWFDREEGETVNCVQDSSAPILRPGGRSSSGSSSSGRSPENLLHPAFADWLKDVSPRSKVFAVSRKDRSAILMGGKKADAAFWYDSRTGQFVTSRYYFKNYPAWMQEFHEKEIVDSYFGKTWEPLPVEPAKYLELGIERLDQGAFERNFPYPFGWAEFSPDRTFYTSFYASPFIDTYIAELGRAIIENELLGGDEHLDVLALGFSALDAVGHEHGPNSPEVLDVFLRLDETLTELFRFLDNRIGMEHVAVVLTSDHGVMTLPEYLESKGEPGRRFATKDVTCYQRVEKKLDALLGEDDWLLEGLYLDYEAIGRKNVRREDVENALAKLIGECPPVETVWTRTQLESTSPSGDRFLAMYKNSFHPDRSPDLHVQVKPFHLIRQDRGTSHGTPYEYDTHVPLYILTPGVVPSEVTERVHTVDVAPTLASIFEVPAPTNLDGKDRSDVFIKLDARTEKR
jgi:predicted AlkP superfamily pyrophosphatase or phosphodiesterase